MDIMRFDGCLKNGIVIGNRGEWTIWSCAWINCLGGI